MRAIVCCILLSCTCLLTAADWKPTEATITMKSGNESVMYVTEVSVDKVMAGQTPDGISQASINYRDIRGITWNELDDNLHYAKARGDMNSGEYERAIDNFSKVAETRKEIFAIKGREGLADAYAALDRYDEAVAALDEIIAQHPEWPWLPEIVYRKGELQLAAGQLDAAEQTFASLAGMSSTYGPTAESSSLLGRAQVRIARKDNVGAAKLLAEAFGKVSADSDPALRGRIGLLLSAQQEQAGQADAGLDTLEQIKFLPLAPDDLSRVHSHLGAILLERGEPRRAFDHAVLGTVVPGADATALGEARTVARRVRAAIEASGDFTDEEKLAYRQAYDKL